MTVYINPNNFQCFCNYQEGFIELDTELFEGKCAEYIEGYRLIPFGYNWRRKDGKIFKGQVMMPWRDIRELNEIQSVYERNKIDEYSMALETLGVVL